MIISYSIGDLGILMKLHCDHRRTFLVITGGLISFRKSLWSVNIRIASIPAPTVRGLIGSGVACTVAHLCLYIFPGIAVTGHVHEQEHNVTR